MFTRGDLGVVRNEQYDDSRIKAEDNNSKSFLILADQNQKNLRKLLKRETFARYHMSIVITTTLF